MIIGIYNVDDTVSFGCAAVSTQERKVPSGLLLTPCDGLKAAMGGMVTCATPNSCSVSGNASVATCFDDASKQVPSAWRFV